MSNGEDRQEGDESMWPAIAGGAIGAGALLGGALINREAAKDIRRKEEEKQVKFAKNTIQWKVADAIAAGIHPLYALGAATQSYQPLGVTSGDMALGNAVAEGGQQIGRAVEKMLDSWQRKMQEAQLKEAQASAKKEEVIANFLERKYNEEPAMPMPGVDPIGDYYGILGQGNIVKGIPGSNVVTGEPPSQVAPGQQGAEVVPPQVTQMKAPGVEAGVAGEERAVMGEGGWINLELTRDLTELVEDNLPFKVRYYTKKLSDLWDAYMAFAGGRKSKRHQEFIKKAKKWLGPGPKDHFLWFVPNKGFKWVPNKYYRKDLSERLFDLQQKHKWLDPFLPY